MIFRMVKYDKKKLKEFNEATIKEYNQSLFLDKVTNVRLTNKTDGNFTQIGMKFLFEEDMFVFQNYTPRLPGLGRAVSLGERDFFIKTLIEDVRIEKIKIKKRDFNPENLRKYLKHFKQNILIPVELQSNIFNSKMLNHIEFTSEGMKFDFSHKLIPVPTKILKNKVIIFDELSLIWEKEVFKNKFSEEDEKIDVQVEEIPSEGKAEILVRSVNKIHYFPEYIKILDIEE